ncbi:MAG TPA: acyl-CoA reductase [Bacteroidales bacterium]|nr:acyl-CoA reductase [Bacteroidales bacterium]
MDLKKRIESFSELGAILRDTLAGKENKYSAKLLELIENLHYKNEWFTAENVRSATKAIADELTEENLTGWTNAYPELKDDCSPEKIAVIMAGNIPLVGFHDFLSVLICGDSIIAKTSSKDSDLIVSISDILCSVNPEFKNLISFTEDTIRDFDAVIATGSNNSSRYFEYYFGKYPHIIRKNRNSIAIIDGKETNSELQELGNDIFLYFGLGCRNVSKIYVPKGYDFSKMTNNWKKFSGIINHNKYANNYDFNKAIYLVNKDKFQDTGFLLIKEENKIASPVSVLFFEYYESESALKQETELLKNNIQCIVGRHNVPFGKAQLPHLSDYADGIDTIDFLLKKKTCRDNVK